MLLAATTAHGQTTDLDILTASVPPNVLLVFDNSGSMNQHLWDDDFDPTTRYAGFCGWPQVPTISGSDCGGVECPDNEYVNWGGGMPHFLSGGGASQSFSACGVTRTVYRDTGSALVTRYSLNYLNWLFGSATAADLADEPTATRMQTAKTASTEVVESLSSVGGGTDRVRFGLMQFDQDSAAEGGEVVTEIDDGSAPDVIAGITAADAVAWTPLSETLVDAGRYFAGLENKLGAFSKSSLKSPVDLQCRKNFALVMTDGQPSQDLHDHTGTAFLTSIGNYDADANECSLDAPAVCTDAPSSGRDDGLVYTFNGTDWLDDTAAYLHDADFDPDIDGTQNLVTYTIGFVVDHPLLQETADAGGGKYYVTGSGGAASLAANLSAALDDILERSASFASAAVPATRTSYGDAFYASYFVPSAVEPFWPGHLEAYGLANDGSVLDAAGDPALDPNTGAFIEPRNPVWDAAARLAVDTSRALFTTVGGSRVALDATSVTAAELGLLAGEHPLYSGYDTSGISDPSDPNQVGAAIASALVDYVYGRDGFDDDFDGDHGELRPVVLGDLFHSRPRLVGPPTRLLSTEEGYGVTSPSAPLEAPFKEQFGTRDRVVYAGANDGLLHAFHAGDYTGADPLYTAGTGDELFGYAPGLLLDTLKHLPRNLPREHYFVDGNPVVAEAWLGDGNAGDITKEPGEWATVLVSGFRQGGEGYLALDVTDPSGSSPAHSPYPKLLWEFTDPSMGESWSEPVITRVKLLGDPNSGDHCGRSDGDGDCREKWVAIFAAGYAQEGDPSATSFAGDPNDPGWTERGKALFVVDLRSGSVLARLAFDATGATGPSEMKFAIPSAPAVLDLDFDGFADVVYAGDLGGQLFKWDLSAVGVDSVGDPEIDNWPGGVFFRTEPEDLGSGVLHHRSFYYPPSAAFLDDTLLLAFGTGERSDMGYPGDAGADENNRFFVVRDAHPTGALAFAGAVLGELDLTDVTSLYSDDDPTDAGFFFTAEDSEKFVTNHVIFSGYVITASYLPSAGSGDPCEQAGTSQLYVFDLASALGHFGAPGLPPVAGRRVVLGPGAPTDPRVTLSPDGDTIYTQTSSARLILVDAPVRSVPDLWPIYWRRVY